MANTLELKTTVEEWYRNTIRKRNPNARVEKENIPLEWGGLFECDVVVKSKNKILEIHCFSTSEYKTDNGKAGSGKLFKIKADALMLSSISCPIKILAFTGRTMYDKVWQEQENGRFPFDIKIEYVETPESIKNKIMEIKEEAVEAMI
jgi:hypothetical protein